MGRFWWKINLNLIGFRKIFRTRLRRRIGKFRCRIRITILGFWKEKLSEKVWKILVSNYIKFNRMPKKNLEKILKYFDIKLNNLGKFRARIPNSKNIYLNLIEKFTERQESKPRSIITDRTAFA